MDKFYYVTQNYVLHNKIYVINRSEYKLLGQDGKMEFKNAYNFKTRRPVPVLAIKLKKFKDGLFLSYSREFHLNFEVVSFGFSVG